MNEGFPAGRELDGGVFQAERACVGQGRNARTPGEGDLGI